MHVDEFIENSFADMRNGRKNAYARFVLNYFRLPATLIDDFHPFMRQHKLFCTYEGRRYRCTGASRLGDVWLAKDASQERGYSERVDVEKCTDWSDAP